MPAAVLARARENAQAIASLAGVDIGADETIGGRAALLGLPPAGRISSGGATRLMDGPGGWCALTLSRPDDLAAVPALIERLNADEYVPVRAQAARALAKIGRADVLPALERAAQRDTEASVVEAARAAIAQLKAGREG